MYYLDRALEKDISQVPKSTTVIMYGDHESRVEYGAANKSPDGVELVPLIIYKVGSDIAAKQRTRYLPIVMDDRLNLLDAVNFIRAGIMR